MTKKSLFISLLAVMAGVLMVTGSVSASSYDGATVGPEPGMFGPGGYQVCAGTGDTIKLMNIPGNINDEVDVKFKNDVCGTIWIEQTATKADESDTNAPGEVYSYYNVTLVGITNADIDSYIWKFDVTKSWLSDHGLAASNIFLYHYVAGNGWGSLSTKAVSTTDNVYNFESTGSSFSDFAIAGSSGLTNAGSSIALYALLGLALPVTGLVAYKINGRKKAKA